MVTTTPEEAKQIVQQQEQQLSQAESQLKAFASRRPTRKETLGVASRFRDIQQQQQQVVRQPLLQVQQERDRLQSARQEISRVEQENIRIAERNKQIADEVRDIQIVNKFLAEGKSPATLTQRQKALFRSASEGSFLQKKETLSQLKVSIEERLKMSLTPERLQREFAKELPPVSIPQDLTSSVQQQARIDVADFSPSGIFFKPKELEARGIVITEGIGVPTGEARAIQFAEEFIGVKDSGVAFIPSEDLMIKAKETLADKDFKELVEEGFEFGARKFVETADILGRKAGLEKALKDTPLDIRVPTESTIGFTEDIAKFAFFSPVFGTTAQIERALFETAQVEFVGTTSQTVKGVVRTDILFDVTKGGITRKGVAKGLSKLTPSEEALIFRTAGIGGTARKAIEFPTGKEVFKDIELFSGRELGFLKSFEKDLFGTVSVGRVARKLKLKKGKLTPKDIQEFESLSLGLAKGDLAFSFGQTTADTSTAFFKGLIKRVPPKTTGVKFEPAAIGELPSKQLLEQVSATQLQDIISASFIEKAIITPKVVPPISIFKPKPTPSPKPSPKLESDLIGIPRSVGGRGLTPAQLDKARGGLFEDFAEPLVFPPSVKGQTIIKTLQSDLTIQVPKFKTQTLQADLTIQIPGLAQDQPTKLRQRLRLRQEGIEKEVQKLSQSILQEVAQSTKQRQKLRQKQQLRQKQVTTQGFRTSLTPRARGRFKLLPPRIASLPKGDLEGLTTKQLGFDTFVKVKKKFVRVNKKSLPRSQALDLGANIVDNTVSNRFKIKPVGLKADIGGLPLADLGVFSSVRNKFRGFRIRKGKRIPLKNEFIEKKGRPRIDTKGEKKGLSVARFLKQRKRRFAPIRKKPKKKKKGVINFIK